MAKPAGSSVGSSYGLVYELDFHDAEPFRRRGGERAPKGSPVLAISALPTNTVVDVVRALFDHCMEARRGGELMSDHMWTLGERYVSDGGFGFEFDEVPQSERRSTPLSQVPELQREGAVLRFEYDMGNTSAMTMVVRKLRALDQEESAREGDWPRKRGGGRRRAPLPEGAPTFDTCYPHLAEWLLKAGWAGVFLGPAAEFLHGAVEGASPLYNGDQIFTPFRFDDFEHWLSLANAACAPGALPDTEEVSTTREGWINRYLYPPPGTPSWTAKAAEDLEMLKDMLANPTFENRCGTLKVPFQAEGVAQASADLKRRATETGFRFRDVFPKTWARFSRPDVTVVAQPHYSFAKLSNGTLEVSSGKIVSPRNERLVNPSKLLASERGPFSTAHEIFCTIEGAYEAAEPPLPAADEDEDDGDDDDGPDSATEDDDYADRLREQVYLRTGKWPGAEDYDDYDDDYDDDDATASGVKGRR